MSPVHRLPSLVLAPTGRGGWKVVSALDRGGGNSHGGNDYGDLV